jgi:hypothetical protein
LNIEEKADKVIERFKKDGLLKEDASAEAMARLRKKVIQILESKYKNNTSQNAI